MKINDIVSEGVLGSIGRGLGAVGRGVVRGLDFVGGGDGSTVGTAQQQQAFKQKQADKQFQQKLASFANLGHTATLEFLSMLKRHGVDINRAGTFNPAEIQQELKFFAEHFFASDADKVISQYVKHHVDAEPLPNQINPTTIQQYLETVNQYRTDAFVDRYKAARTVAMHNVAAQEKEKIAQAQQQVEIDNLVAKIKHDEQVAAKERKRYGKESAELAKRLILNKKLYTDLTGDQLSFSPQPKQQQQPAANKPVVTPAGVQVVSMNPIHFRYKKQDYILKTDAAGNEKWVNIAGKDIPSVTADFLNRQLEAL